MIRTVLFLLLFTFSITGVTQDSKIASILRQKEIKRDYYEMAEAGSSVLYLPMSFGESSFSFNQESAIKRLKGALIAQVDLVYSDYPASQDFSALNKKRFESLRAVLPSLFSDPNISFNKIRQTIAKTKSTAESLQHGFFIYFRPKPSKESAITEISKMKGSLIDSEEESKDRYDVEEDIYDSLTKWCGMKVVSTDKSFYGFKDSTGVPKGLDSNWAYKRWALKDYLKSGLYPEIDSNYYKGFDSIYHIEYVGPCPDYSGDIFLYHNVDSTVSSVFKRNKWENAMIISDVTGSMYPYTAQLLKWLKLNLTDKEKKYFLFFNDGDNKEEKDKVIGKIGGIYSVLTNNYDEVEKTIEKAMLNGGGGDAPENNIEALLESEKVCGGCDSIVMIVDNWAPIKDISLLGKFHKPVKVVVCGVLGTINKDYLKLVRETKGSLHLIEEDIYNLSEMKEGETIKIKGGVYKLIKGEFVEISNLSP